MLEKMTKTCVFEGVRLLLCALFYMAQEIARIRAVVYIIIKIQFFFVLSDLGGGGVLWNFEVGMPGASGTLEPLAYT